MNLIILLYCILSILTAHKQVKGKTLRLKLKTTLIITDKLILFQSNQAAFIYQETCVNVKRG